MSLIWTVISRERRAEFGGGLKLMAGVAIDIPLAALLAPAVMVTQIIALVGLLSGRRSGWTTQRRDVDAVSAGEAFSRYRPQVFVGLALTAMCMIAPSLTLWLIPVITGLLLAPWIVMLTSRRDLGLWMKRIGVFFTPEEIYPAPVLVEGSAQHGNVVHLPVEQFGSASRFDVGAWAGREPVELT